MAEGKFHVSFYVDIELLPQVLNSVLPVGVFDFKTEFVRAQHSIPIQGQFLALPPPINGKKMKERPTKAPGGRAAQIIRRVVSHKPEASLQEINKALSKAGMNPNQGAALQSLMKNKEIKRVGWGMYSMMRD